MFQSQPKFHPTPYYAIASYGQGLPQYNYQERPLEETAPEFGPGAGGVGGELGPSCGGSLIFTTPAFNFGTVNEHDPAFSAYDNASNSVDVNAPNRINHNVNLGHKLPTRSYSALGMEQTQDDLVAQEAAAREYEPQLKVRSDFLNEPAPPPQTKRHTRGNSAPNPAPTAS